jgi:tricorn protease
MQDFDRRQKNAAAFDLAWRTMRDNFYDERLGNRDWDAVRMKYLDAARQAVDADALAVVVNLMLGELNGSHLGFSVGSALRRPDPNATPEPAAGRWAETTGHLGLRFDPTFAGPGLKVRDVLPGGPADLKRTRIRAGEVVTAINGQPVNPGADLARLLTGPPNREIAVRVTAGDAKERTVAIRPISYPAARQLLYKQWVENNRKAVDKLSDGRLGYLHIDAMAMPSFYKFEAELYSVGAGKDGLVIDVRENGGGSTADHLLTALCQPVHAITVPRGGGPGYPQDRKVYASWNKPVVVLCNQNSFSNAEIFSHAIKTLKRGQLVGVPTAGGVISTGGTGIMDVGFLRLPFRGWYLLNDGRDMELNGAVPDHIIWPEPGEMPAGKDRQLEKAVAVLGEDVRVWKARPQPKLTKASESEPGGKSERPVVKGADD